MYGLKLCMHMQHMQLFKQAIVPRYNFGYNVVYHSNVCKRRREIREKRILKNLIKSSMSVSVSCDPNRFFKLLSCSLANATYKISVSIT